MPNLAGHLSLVLLRRLSILCLFLLRPDMVSIRQVSRHDHEKRHNVFSLLWTYFVYTTSSFPLSLDQLMEQVMKMMWTFVAFFLLVSLKPL